MKIAIAVTSSETDALVAEQGARAPYYLLFDTENRLFETMPNPAAQAERAAGPMAAAFLISRDVSSVVAGEFGPKFRSELEGGGIICLEKGGTVSEVVAEFN